ncbi:MAG: phage holin family protein [Burkholderiaceae bacterium]
MGDDVEQLLRAHGRLAEAELRHKLKAAAYALLWLGAGAVLALLGVFLLVQAAVVALSTVVSLQAALLAVAIVLVATAFGLIGHGRQCVTSWHLTPRRSLDALRATIHQFKEKMK